MNIRNGFVSNSSSSSFVICGFKIETSDIKDIYKKMLNLSEEELINQIKKIEKAGEEDIDDEWVEDFCRDNIDTLDGLDFIDDERNMYVGIILGEGDECGDIDSNTFVFADIGKFLIELSEKLNLDIKDAKIFSGARWC